MQRFLHIFKGQIAQWGGLAFFIGEVVHLFNLRKEVALRHKN